MDPMYSSEEISLNLKVRKLGYKMIFNPKVFVYHIDRNFKHFLDRGLFTDQQGYGALLDTHVKRVLCCL